MLIKYNMVRKINTLDRKGESQKKTADQLNLFLLILSCMPDARSLRDKALKILASGGVHSLRGFESKAVHKQGVWSSTFLVSFFKKSTR